MSALNVGICTVTEYPSKCNLSENVYGSYLSTGSEEWTVLIMMLEH